MHSATHWFEIPAADLERAARFYERVLDQPLRREDFFGQKVAVFAYQNPGIGGAILLAPERRPGPGGTRVFLAATGRLDECLARVEGAGGRVLEARTAIGPAGFIALFEDTEGNHVALHSPT
jgi:predicted enzyme related to lactoylglutathione lyase